MEQCGIGNNPFVLAGYTQEQADQLTEIANQYSQVGISARESAQMIIKALLPFISKESNLRYWSNTYERIEDDE